MSPHNSGACCWRPALVLHRWQHAISSAAGTTKFVVSHQRLITHKQPGMRLSRCVKPVGSKRQCPCEPLLASARMSVSPSKQSRTRWGLLVLLCSTGLLFCLINWLTNQLKIRSDHAVARETKVILHRLIHSFACSIHYLLAHFRGFIHALLRCFFCFC